MSEVVRRVWSIGFRVKWTCVSNARLVGCNCSCTIHLETGGLFIYIYINLQL